MSLERRNLREELVAIIAAGRELSPEYDYVLADVYLDVASRHQTRQTWLSRFLEGPNRVRNLVAAGCLALAGMLLPFLLFHDADAGAIRANPAIIAPRGSDSDDFYMRDGPWWRGDGSQQQNQFPPSPSFPISPNG